MQLEPARLDGQYALLASAQEGALALSVHAIEAVDMDRYRG